VTICRPRSVLVPPYAGVTQHHGCAVPAADLLVPFFVASAIFACVPGPGMFYAAAQSMASGRRSGWYAAVGFHLAGLGHIAAAAFGVSILLQMIPTLFIVMKVVGAGYLIWLGIRSLLRRTPLHAHNPAPKLQAAKALKNSVVVGALNPKSALFYLAFLPQFTDAAASLPVWAQIVVLGIVVNAMFTVTDVILIEMSHTAMRRLKASERVAVVLQRIGGSILIALGVNLAFARQ
jgi:threonine/homoserine/homoserine lactone efflux protein